MGNKIIICGLNGAGKSTLGRALANELGWHFMDIEDYYFSENTGDYKYEASRTKEDVSLLLARDLKSYDNVVFSAVKGNYGKEVTALFTSAIFVSVPKEVRMRRVRERSYEKYGDRILFGGDLYEKEEKFFEMVEKRSEDTVREWLETMDIPVLEVDGTLSVEENVRIICESLVIVKHKIFGKKEAVNYIDREGAYIIPINNGKVGVVETKKGYFLLGGGLKDGESHSECIERECMEEAGCAVFIKEKVCSAETYCRHSEIGFFHPIQTYYVGEITEKLNTETEENHKFVWLEYGEIKGKMFLEMQNWALEQCYDFVVSK